MSLHEIKALYSEYRRILDYIEDGNYHNEAVAILTVTQIEQIRFIVATLEDLGIKKLVQTIN